MQILTTRLRICSLVQRHVRISYVNCQKKFQNSAMIFWYLVFYFIYSTAQFDSTENKRQKRKINNFVSCFFIFHQIVKTSHLSFHYQDARRPAVCPKRCLSEKRSGFNVTSKTAECLELFIIGPNESRLILIVFSYLMGLYVFSPFMDKYIHDCGTESTFRA